MAVSQEFAPPFKLIAPYFIIGVLVYALSVLLLFSFDITTLSHLDSFMLSWVHLLLLGFVMMVIFGAMAQLVPVVLEVGHFAVELYYIIYPLLFIGTFMMVLGFAILPALLPYGGLVVLISLIVFIFETFMTLRRVKKFNLVMSSVALANSFLFLGLIFGIVMALGYAGVVSVDIMALLKGHIYLVFIGYVGVTIMGMSMVLLPMFWLSHSFSWKSVTSALWLVTLGVLSVSVSSLFESLYLEYAGYILTISALFLYFNQMYIIYKTRVRLENDIYFRSMFVSYIALFISLVLGIIYLFLPSQNLLLAIAWMVIFGYVSFMILGHLYKIVPFLVWFERFSPLVGKEKVPMLADMLPVRSSNLQFIFSLTGILVGFISILMQNNLLFHAGVSFLFLGSVFVVKDLIYMIRFK